MPHGYGFQRALIVLGGGVKESGFDNHFMILLILMKLSTIFASENMQNAKICILLCVLL